MITDPDVYAHEWDMHDPDLTRKGIRQCAKLAEHLAPRFSYEPSQCRIVVSPLTRTLQTVQHGLQFLIERGVPVEARAEWQVRFIHSMGSL